MSDITRNLKSFAACNLCAETRLVGVEKQHVYHSSTAMNQTSSYLELQEEMEQACLLEASTTVIEGSGTCQLSTSRTGSVSSYKCSSAGGNTEEALNPKRIMPHSPTPTSSETMFRSELTPKDSLESFYTHGVKLNVEGRQLDEGLWSQLPEPLLDRVLAWLPIRSYFRFRVVCKRWSSLVNDPSFLMMCAIGPSHAPWCVVPQETGYTMYDAESHSWHKWPEFEFPTIFIDSVGRSHRLPTNFINLSGHSYHSHMGLDKYEKYEIVAASSGLLLLEHCYDSCRTLFVTNPINRSTRLLSLPVQVKMTDLSRILGMVMDEETKSYKLFAVYGSVEDDATYRNLPRFQLNIEGWLSYHSQAPLQFNVYDSSSHKWTKTGEWNKQFRRYFRSLAFFKGCICCLASDRQFDVLDDFQTYHVYCIAPEGWLELKSTLPSSLNFAHLFENRGRLMLAGGFGDIQSLETLNIWHLDPDNLKWVKVHSMPPDLISELSLPDTFYYGCVSSGDYVCVCNSIRKLVMCDMTRDHWWLVPKCPLSTDRPRSFLDEMPCGQLFMFQPRLDLFA